MFGFSVIDTLQIFCGGIRSSNCASVQTQTVSAAHSPKKKKKKRLSFRHFRKTVLKSWLAEMMSFRFPVFKSLSANLHFLQTSMVFENTTGWLIHTIIYWCCIMKPGCVIIDNMHSLQLNISFWPKDWKIIFDFYSKNTKSLNQSWWQSVA